MRKLALHTHLGKDLSTIPPKQYRQLMTAIIELLKEPFPHYSRPLAGSSFFRLEVGEFRVIYNADDDTVSVLGVGKRNDSEVFSSRAGGVKRFFYY
jgi:mRNA interferase RelE/StbE